MSQRYLRILQKNFPDNKYYVLMSDGELHEGSIWEAALLIGSLKLKNITLIIDNNDLQSSTKSTDTHPSLYPIGEKFKSFSQNSHLPFNFFALYLDFFDFNVLS